MAKQSFADVVLELDEACNFLRDFTLGRTGSTQRSGMAGIQRVNEQCERMKKLFASGPYAQKLATVVASARSRVIAAETRLALMRKK